MTVRYGTVCHVCCGVWRGQCVCALAEQERSGCWAVLEVLWTGLSHFLFVGQPRDCGSLRVSRAFVLEAALKFPSPVFGSLRNRHFPKGSGPVSPGSDPSSASNKPKDPLAGPEAVRSDLFWPLLHSGEPWVFPHHNGLLHPVSQDLSHHRPLGTRHPLPLCTFSAIQPSWHPWSLGLNVSSRDSWLSHIILLCFLLP